MQLELVFKSMFFWTLSIFFGIAMWLCIKNIRYYKAKDKKKRRKITKRDVVAVSTSFICMIFYLFIGAIPNTLDAYLYSTNSYITTTAKVIETVYESGRGYRNFSKHGYVTKFLINGKSKDLKVQHRLIDGKTYVIQYLPYTKYVFSVR